VRTSTAPSIDGDDGGKSGIASPSADLLVVVAFVVVAAAALLEKYFDTTT
jgi:hypothetical protein